VGQFFDGWTNTAMTLLWGVPLVIGVAMFLSRTVQEAQSAARDAAAAARANQSDAAESRAITFGALCLLFVVCMVFAYREYQQPAPDMNWFYGWLAAGGGALGIAYLFYFPEFANNATPLGNARLSTHAELAAARLVGSKFGEGIRLGFEVNVHNGGPGEVIRYRGPGNLITVAPPRSGKFYHVLAAALMEFQGSCIVIDPKGQMAAVTNDAVNNWAGCSYSIRFSTNCRSRLARQRGLTRWPPLSRNRTPSASIVTNWPMPSSWRKGTLKTAFLPRAPGN
jgi:hypothetical protein